MRITKIYLYSLRSCGNNVIVYGMIPARTMIWIQNLYKWRLAIRRYWRTTQIDKIHPIFACFFLLLLFCFVFFGVFLFFFCGAGFEKYVISMKIFEYIFGKTNCNTVFINEISEGNYYQPLCAQAKRSRETYYGRQNVI